MNDISGGLWLILLLIITVKLSLILSQVAKCYIIKSFFFISLQNSSLPLCSCFLLRSNKKPSILNPGQYYI